MKMELPFPVLHSLFLLNEAGYEAYVVGGCVRDALMGCPPTDWDITTSALPQETLAVFRDFRTIETGIQHGTVTVIIDDTPLEITTYRVDGDYSDGRHPDAVTFTRSLKEDLKRRDFTVNAMAYHPQLGLVDYFHGRRDLKRKTIRCVGDPKKRFSEDALRILRGLRFSSVLGFSLHPATRRAICRLADTLKCVSIERIAVEWQKLIGGKNKAHVLREYADVLSVVLPDVDCRKAAQRGVFATTTANWAALMLDLSPQRTEEVCRYLRLSNRMTEDVTALVRYRDLPLDATRRGVLHALHVLGPRLTEELIELRRNTVDGNAFHRVWDQLERDMDCVYRLKDLAVTGDDLILAGIPAGPEIGKVLDSLLEEVMSGACPNEKEPLMELAIKKPVR